MILGNFKFMQKALWIKNMAKKEYGKTKMKPTKNALFWLLAWPDYLIQED